MSPADAELKILTTLAKLLAQGMGEPDWAARALLRRPQLRRAVSQILAALATEADRAVDAQRARIAIDEATRAAAAARRVAAPTPSRSLTPTVVAPPLAQANAVRDVIPTVLRETDDVYRKVVAQVMAQPITTEKDRLNACQRALDSLTRQGITGFVDRAGRKWNLTSYLEAATRTAQLRASSDWYAHELSKRGVDLVRVSWHQRCAPQCAPFQGRLLSISGATSGPVGVTARGELIEVATSLTQARARGFQHVNCRHFLIGWVPGDSLDPPAAVDPQDYRDEQTLRRRERAVRLAKTRLATALTPERQTQAKRAVAATQKALREHVAATGVRRQRGREQLNKPR